MGFGFDDIIGNAVAPGLYSAGKALGGGYSKGGPDGLGWIDNLASDYMNVGKNKYQNQNFTPEQVNYGGGLGADAIAQMGFNRMGSANTGSSFAQNQMRMDRGPQAMEDQYLSNLEASSRGGDQAGALQLAREAAMGQAPSQAAYQLQAGLDRGMAQQQAVAGSARGLGGVSVASANANAAMGNMANQAYTEGGRLRAQEMADSRGLYGNLAGQMRGQDQARLQMGNQMSQFNAQNNDQYRLGMGSLANQYNNTGAQWYQAAQNPYNQQSQLDFGRQQLAADSFNQGQARIAGVNQANSDARSRQTDRIYGLAGSAVNMGGQMGASQMKGKS